MRFLAMDRVEYDPAFLKSIGRSMDIPIGGRVLRVEYKGSEQYCMVEWDKPSREFGPRMIIRSRCLKLSRK
jgi:hypothetical protein